MPEIQRNPQLDFFRGLALIFIFIDHIPNNFLGNLTLQNLAISDAAEIFVFIAGYTAALVFGRTFIERGFLFAAAQTLRRCWTLYVAHVFLFVIFTAEVAWTARRFRNPMFAEEMNVASFLSEPHIAVLKALTLEFQPAFMNIIPLYIVLLMGFVPMMVVLRANVGLGLTISAAIYAAARSVPIQLPAYPEGIWYFNPFAWQFLFVAGAALAFARLDGHPPLRFRVWHGAVAGSALLFFLLLNLVWRHEESIDTLQPWFANWIVPLADKSDLGPLRLLNFAALAVVAVIAFKKDHALFKNRFAQPVIRCGQHSLHVFCLGIFLSFVGHFLLVEVGSALWLQTAINIAGIAAMILLAETMTWYRARERAPGRKK